MAQRFRRPAARSGRSDGAALPTLHEITITDLGGGGDGLANVDGQTFYVRGGVPGDRLLVRRGEKRGDGLAATIQQILDPSPLRQSPPCPHYPPPGGNGCGGCSLQHLSPTAHDRFKEERVRTALRRAGLDDDTLRPLVTVRQGQRRRAALAFVVQNGKTRLGFNQAGSHRICDVQTCLQLQPELLEILPPLRPMLAQVVANGQGGDLLLTNSLSGLDVLIKAPAQLDLFNRETLAAFAETHDLARLFWQCDGRGEADPIATRRSPQVQFAGVPVTIPVGGFLQPSRQGETTLITLVVDALRGCRKVADLFCGCGTFALPLAVNGAQVLAVEDNAAALSALDHAARARTLPVRCLHRDLDRRPLGTADLQGLDGLVFDPPRAGAMAQAHLLATAGPPKLVAVSCNPATLARDLKILVQGGYNIEQITPVDQFPLTPHLEAVAVLHRK